MQCVKTMVTVSLFVASVAFANDASLSNAEVAALAHRAAIRAEQSVKFCEHTLIYGSDEAKAHLLSVLEGQSCGEAAGSSTDQESSP